MNRIITLIGVSVLAVGVNAQNCPPGRYVDMQHFSDVAVTTGVIFGSNTSVYGGAQTLRLDIYEPAGDLMQDRPVVIVAFGGSFVAGSRADVAAACQAFARMGYVAVAPDYRVGFFSINALNTTRAVMRGAHDMKACVRFLRRSVEELENPYRIDPDRIIMGGVSAGAISALHATYLDQEEEFPPVLAAEIIQLGGVEGNSGSAGYSSDVFACYSLSGAIGDTSWISIGDQPLVSIHETGDQVVPFNTQQVSVLSIPTGLVASGSNDVHRRMNNLGLTNCLLPIEANAHVGYLTSQPTITFGFLGQFFADLICGQPVNCGNLITGIGPLHASEGTLLGPNPTTGELAVDMGSGGPVLIYDARGREVFQRRLPAGRSTLDLSVLPSGVYLLRTLDGSLAHRIVKVD